MKIIPNKKLSRPQKKGDFDISIAGGALSLPVDFYNFAVNENVSTAKMLFQLFQEKPNTVAAFLGWNRGHLQAAIEKLVKMLRKHNAFDFEI